MAFGDLLCMFPLYRNLDYSTANAEYSFLRRTLFTFAETGFYSSRCFVYVRAISIGIKDCCGQNLTHNSNNFNQYTLTLFFSKRLKWPKLVQFNLFFKFEFKISIKSYSLNTYKFEQFQVAIILCLLLLFVICIMAAPAPAPEPQFLRRRFIRRNFIRPVRRLFLGT